MEKRLPASRRPRQSLSELIEGRLASPDGRAELVKLATRLIVEEALEAECRDALGRDYHERGAEEGRGYRNGVRTARLKTAEGLIDFAAPQVAGREEPFRSEIRQHLKGRTEALEGLAVELLARGLRVPLLVVSDGAPGVIKAIESCFPRSERQRCLAHRMRNLAAKVPEDQWPELKARIQACYQASSRAIARDLATGAVADYGKYLPSAVACFEDDFEACIAHLRMPVTHRRAIRTTNLLERLFLEERRRLKIIPNAFGERPVLKLMFGAMTRAADPGAPSGSPTSSAGRSQPSGKTLIRSTRHGSTHRPVRQHRRTRPVFPAILGLDRDAVFDTLAAGIGTALSADRTLGGLCDWVEAEAPRPVELEAQQVEVGRRDEIDRILVAVEVPPELRDVPQP